jgi:hypothetical protein
VLDLIRSHLPPWERACALVAHYTDTVAWLFRGVTHAQLVDELLPGIYVRLPPDAQPTGTAGTGDHAVCAHGHALLFNIFAIASFYDFANPERLQEADHFNQLSCAALGLRSVFDSPGIVTVQALQIAFAFSGIRGGDAMERGENMEVSWSYISLAAQVSQIVCLLRHFRDDSVLTPVFSSLKIGLRE